MSYDVLVPPTARREEWLAARKQGIGASDSAAILGDSSWGTPLTVFQEKTSAVVEDRETERMRWGNRLERPILEAVAEDMPDLGDVIPTEGLLKSLQSPWLLGTLDAQLESPSWGRVPLEAKNVSGFQARDWRDGDLTVVPPKYTVQVRQQAYITGAPGGYVAALFDGNHLEVLWVPQDDQFVERHLQGTLRSFWEDNVLAGVAPDPVLGDDLAALWPMKAQETVRVDDTFLEMRDRWIDAKQREKDARDDIAALRHYFGVFMETAQYAVDERDQQWFALTERLGQRRITVDRHAEHHPDCVECVIRDASSRTPKALFPKEVA